jgi:hypothetical protein
VDELERRQDEKKAACVLFDESVTLESNEPTIEMQMPTNLVDKTKIV